MALAGHGVVVRSADTDATGDIVDGVTNIEWNYSAELLETTDFADGQDRERPLQGLRDLQVTLSGDLETADAGQARLRTNHLSGAVVWLRFLPNGSAGYKAPFKISEFSISAEVAGKAEFSCTAQLDASEGAVGTV
jgi:predicted secreted protein